MSVTDEFRADAWSPESDLYLVLLTIEHPDLDPPISVVNNTVNVISNGISYVAFPGSRAAQFRREMRCKSFRSM